MNWSALAKAINPPWKQIGMALAMVSIFGVLMFVIGTFWEIVLGFLIAKFGLQATATVFCVIMAAIGLVIGVIMPIRDRYKRFNNEVSNSK